MSDYGHELAFGVFVTPSNQRAADVVELARLAERVGLDLVTFQDHPYQPAFLDAWTLMSYVAARTERVHLAGNVLNLPLRSPAVLARSAASLDLLSGGRVELGIGAGAFWDAIEAMGGRRLAAGQAVTALAEAIEIIRQVWDTDARGGVRVAGDHYRVVGAKRGPAPAHAIGIWVGGYKPRMLRLIGRLADGWLPSLGYVQPPQLVEGNAIVDEAAAEAGRDPSAVRRLLNLMGGQFTPTGAGLLPGPAAHWADQLADFALTMGIGTFILASDDPDTIRRFAAEVAPAVRELVAAERTRAAPGGAAAPATGESGAGPTAANRAAIGGAGGAAGPAGWDEATRPTRPATPPGARFSAAGRAASGMLVQVHDMLRRELATIGDLIAQVMQGSKDAGQARSQLNEMAMRQNKWTMGAYCESFCRIVTEHHGLEDASVFPHLRARDPGLVPVLDRLQAEHVVIHDGLDSVDRALVNLVAKPDDFGELREITNLLSDTLLSHLAYEERELLEPLGRHGFF